MFRYLTKKSIKKYILENIESFDKDKKVHFIQAGFQIVQDGLFKIYFDTSEDAGPDGSWTTKLEDSVLRKPSWKFHLSEESKAENIGELIKEVLFECKSEGHFKKLNLAKNCDFGIEEFDGLYGWPEYEQRKKVNLV